MQVPAPRSDDRRGVGAATLRHDGARALDAEVAADLTGEALAHVDEALVPHLEVFAGDVCQRRIDLDLRDARRLTRLLQDVLDRALVEVALLALLRFLRGVHAF